MKNKGTIVGVILIIAILTIGGFYFTRTHLSTTATSSQSELVKKKASKNNKRVKKDNKKILIVVFSRKKGVYGGHNLKKGHTRVIADFIHQRTHAKIYQIEAG